MIFNRDFFFIFYIANYFMSRKGINIVILY